MNIEVQYSRFKNSKVRKSEKRRIIEWILKKVWWVKERQEISFTLRFTDGSVEKTREKWKERRRISRRSPFFFFSSFLDFVDLTERNEMMDGSRLVSLLASNCQLFLLLASIRPSLFPSYIHACKVHSTFSGSESKSIYRTFHLSSILTFSRERVQENDRKWILKNAKKGELREREGLETNSAIPTKSRAKVGKLIRNRKGKEEQLMLMRVYFDELLNNKEPQKRGR